MRDLIGLQAQLLLKRSQSPEQETTHEPRSLCASRVTIVTKMRALPATAHVLIREFRLGILRTHFRNFARSPARAV
jgi:hypothetical protein